MLSLTAANKAAAVLIISFKSSSSSYCGSGLIVVVAGEGERSYARIKGEEESLSLVRADGGIGRRRALLISVIKYIVYFIL